jgi:hypothetical protein
MDESRRELFRTSILSALGGLVAGVAAGYVIEKSHPFAVTNPVPPTKGSVVAVYGTTDGGHTYQWYFFNFEQDSSYCRLYSLPPAPTPVDITTVDTVTWFKVAAPARVTTDTPITYVQSDGTNSTLQVNLDVNYYLKPGPLAALLVLVGRENYQSVGGSWNEIGKS